MPVTFTVGQGGGNIDGNANAIYSEGMAQIFQYAAAYEMLNNAINGLGDDLAEEIAQSTRASAQLVRNTYDTYTSSGMQFSSWNDPSMLPRNGPAPGCVMMSMNIMPFIPP